MATMTSKHVPRPTGDPPMTITRGQTLVDDMEIVRKLCLQPEGPVRTNESHLTFGKPDTTPLCSTQRADYVSPHAPNSDLHAERLARTTEMRKKHFEFQFGDIPSPQSENRASYVPHGLPRDKHIFPIGGPHEKNLSNVFSSSPAKKEWVADFESTNRADYVSPSVLSRLPSKNIGREHRANHFQFGEDKPDMEPTTKSCYKHPPASFQRATLMMEYGPSIELGSKDYPWAKELGTTMGTDYIAPFVAEEDALSSFVRRTPLKLGEDKREMLTEHRGAFKRPEYLDCSLLTDAQLTMLGVTREQILPQKLPLDLLSEGFRNSLGHTFGTVL